MPIINANYQTDKNTFKSLITYFVIGVMGKEVFSYIAAGSIKWYDSYRG